MKKPVEVKVTLFSTGKSFDPRNQKRTDALKDIDRKGSLVIDKKLRKMFGMVEKEGVEDGQ